jgi:hypothetical protein
MIIKFKARKNMYSPKQLVRYVLTDKGKIKNPFGAPIVIRNINRFEVDTIHKDFLENAKHLKKRKGGTYYLHEIIAIHKNEKKLVTKSMLQDLMNTYISMRKGAKDALVIAKSHQDQHIHVMLSTNTCKSSKRDLRMSHNEMRKLLLDFENYHKEKYPELSLSIIHTNKPQRERRNIALEQQNNRKEKEYQLKLRLGKNKKTNKELVFDKINLLFDTATSQKELIEKIEQEKELQIYTYRSKLKGVIYKNTKYRFSTLGISQEKILRLEKLQTRLEELKLLKEVYKSKNKIRSRGY